MCTTRDELFLGQYNNQQAEARAKRVIVYRVSFLKPSDKKSVEFSFNFCQRYNRWFSELAPNCVC